MTTQEMVEWLDPEQMQYGEDRVMARSIVSVIRASEKLRYLVECLVLNEPEDSAADAVSVYQVWLPQAQKALEAYDAATGENG